jgi:SAM-dependent methyltransferase
MSQVSHIDKAYLRKIRANVNRFIAQCAKVYDKKNTRLLDIAPQIHEGASPYFTKARVETLDIDPNSGATFIADITTNNESLIPDNSFDFVVCTEVLEHTLQPFNAVNEIERLLKPGGLVFVTTPFNFRIHGPLPDCWRFTEYGLKELFKNFEIVELETLEAEGRFLMPIHYTLIARKRLD